MSATLDNNTSPKEFASNIAPVEGSPILNKQRFEKEARQRRLQLAREEEAAEAELSESDLSSLGSEEHKDEHHVTEDKHSPMSEDAMRKLMAGLRSAEERNQAEDSETALHDISPQFNDTAELKRKQSTRKMRLVF